MRTKADYGLIRLLRGATVAAVLALAALPNGAQAGDHWLSRVTVKTPNQPDKILSATQAASAGLADVTQSAATSVFDITISLDSNPQGDDDWTVDDGANDADQRAYEERIKEFGRAVFQSTNGAHKIGNVTFYRSNVMRSVADVKWDENCPADQGPRANPSGFGIAGKHIWMCTNWGGAATLMPTPKGSGYTLAHEWSHYAYGLYDEYNEDQCADPAGCRESVPLGTDTAAIPSIMTNQWFATSGTAPAGYTGNAADFLEYSTRNIHPFRSDSTGTNAQKRVFGESGWETLTRDPATDPKFPWLPPRTQYTTLAAPTDPDWIVSNDESAALSELDIHWVGNAAMDLSMDISGSMEGTPLANAKTGANLLIDLVQPGVALGVSSFESYTRRNFAITDIPDPDTGVKASAKAAVNALLVGGSTSLYDGLLFSLNALRTFDPDRPSVVFVLSDGGDNDSSATEASVISAYQAAGVPIVAFAYGSYAPTGTLLTLANSTGGAFFQSPTTVPEIQAALTTAEAQFSDNLLLSSARIPAQEGTSARIIPMDSTLSAALVNVSYDGNPGAFEFHLLLPDGTDSGVSFDPVGPTSYSAKLVEDFFDLNGYGDYELELVNKSGEPRDVTILVSATPAETESYDNSVRFSSTTVNYPADLAIEATVSRGPALTGLDVLATVTDPLDNVFDLPLLDDGKGADRVAGDGTYAASVPYAANGIYRANVTASNAAGNGQAVFQGTSISLREDGTAPRPTPIAVTENFVRVGAASTEVTGVLADDHADDPAGGACTVISDDNADTLGRIDLAGDADCFTFLPGSTTDPIVVRVTSLTSGMDPLLSIYDHTGQTQIDQAQLSTSENSDSGVIFTLSATALDADGIVLVVRHNDPSAATGGYAVSAGEHLPSDTRFVAPTEPALGGGEDGCGCAVFGPDRRDPGVPQLVISGFLFLLPGLAIVLLRRRIRNSLDR